MEVALSVSGILTSILLGLGKWYFNQLNARIKTNESTMEKLKDELAETKKDLELNKQADEHYRESVTKDMAEIKKGQQTILDTFQNFVSEYGFVLKKLQAKELGGG